MMKFSTLSIWLKMKDISLCLLNEMHHSDVFILVEEYWWRISRQIYFFLTFLQNPETIINEIKDANTSKFFIKHFYRVYVFSQNILFSSYLFYNLLFSSIMLFFVPFFPSISLHQSPEIPINLLLFFFFSVVRCWECQQKHFSLLGKTLAEDTGNNRENTRTKKDKKQKPKWQKMN